MERKKSMIFEKVWFKMYSDPCIVQPVRRFGKHGAVCLLGDMLFAIVLQNFFEVVCDCSSSMLYVQGFPVSCNYIISSRTPESLGGTSWSGSQRNPLRRAPCGSRSRCSLTEIGDNCDPMFCQLSQWGASCEGGRALMQQRGASSQTRPNSHPQLPWSFSPLSMY